MPTPYLKKLSEEGLGSIESLEKKWGAAKAIAKKKGQADNYGLITTILQNNLGIKSSVHPALAEWQDRVMARLLDASIRITSGRQTGQGAGGIFYCPQTKNFLLVKRSETGDAAGTWCGLGGGVDATDTSLEHTVRREASEEAGFNGDCALYFLNCHKPDPDFEFHNFLAIVPEEFTPILNEEHTEYKWCPISEWPQPMHEGFMDSLATPEAQAVLKEHCR